VAARPPRWLLAGALGLVVLLVGPPVAAIVTGATSPSLFVMSLWPVAVLVLLWRSRLVVDRDGVHITFLGTRHVAWSHIEAMVTTSSTLGLRGPHLRVREGRPVPLNPLWRADGKPVPAAIEPWARRKRVRIEGEISAATRARPQMLTVAVLVAIGALVGLLVARLTVG
jgi:hypothetical protein